MIRLQSSFDTPKSAKTPKNPKTPDNPKVRTRVILTRVTEKEHAAISRRAKLAGKKLATYIRESALGAVKGSK